jgi:hypothetical protein
VLPISGNEKMTKAIMALIENRKKILSKGFGNTVFYLGNTRIELGMRELIFSDKIYKLPKIRIS